MECLHHKKEVGNTARLRATTTAYGHAHTCTSTCSHTCPPAPSPPQQITRFNMMVDERDRKRKAGETLPPTVAEQLKSGELKMPWTSAK